MASHQPPNRKQASNYNKFKTAVDYSVYVGCGICFICYLLEWLQVIPEGGTSFRLVTYVIATIGTVVILLQGFRELLSPKRAQFPNHIWLGWLLGIITYTFFIIAAIMFGLVFGLIVAAPDLHHGRMK